MEQEFRIFTETSETMGVMFNTYKVFMPAINTFMAVIDNAVKRLIKDPSGDILNINPDITIFKEIVSKPVEPDAIDIRAIEPLKRDIKKFRREIDHLMDDYGKLKDRVAFGGNYIRAILNRPKVYSKEIDPAKYSVINTNIRQVNRALDWVEKVIIDLYNMIDQDLNILTIVNRVYRKRKIYEAGNIINSPIDFLKEDGDEPLPDTTNLDMSEPGELPPEEEPKNESEAQKVDNAEKSKNGVRRKKLYLEFIKMAKKHNPHNSFSSIFDKDVFKKSYQFVPPEMRYFYRISNPMLCVLEDNLTFFPVSQLMKVNSENVDLKKLLIFAATETDLRIFNIEDKKVYTATDDGKAITLGEAIADEFDLYIQDLVGKGDILNGDDEPPEEEITGI